jgi:hypothetical protein
MAVINSTERRFGLRVELPPDFVRPQRRSDCKDGPRPCPWVGCRYHLWADVSLAGSLKVAHDVDPMELEDSCVLDVAARFPRTLEEVADTLGLTRERARQIEEEALAKLVALGMTQEEIQA